MDLVIASTNPSKVRELRHVVEELLPTVSVRSLVDFPNFHFQLAPCETFEENAIQKAVYAAQTLKTPCLADESGLVVPLLGDCKESFRRKRLQDQTKRLPDTKRLLADLQNVDEADRMAFLECVLALATPDGVVKTASARMEGMIALKEQGPSSFDFASVFIKYDYRHTLGQLTESTYMRISHRRKACEKLLRHLRECFSVTTVRFQRGLRQNPEVADVSS